MSKKNISHAKRFDKKLFVQCIVFSVLIIISTLFQISFFKVFGATPAIVLAIICAIGFLCGERCGAICGVVGGFFIDILGSVGIGFSPVLYMLAGHLCGYFSKVFLKRNFLSFIIYSLCVGGIQSCITLARFAFGAKSFNIINIFIKTLMPEFFAFILCVPIVYFTCLGIAKIIQKFSPEN